MIPYRFLDLLDGFSDGQCLKTFGFCFEWMNDTLVYRPFVWSVNSGWVITILGQLNRSTSYTWELGFWSLPLFHWIISTKLDWDIPMIFFFENWYFFWFFPMKWWCSFCIVFFCGVLISLGCREDGHDVGEPLLSDTEFTRWMQFLPISATPNVMFTGSIWSQ